MLKFLLAAHLNHENYILQAFQAPAVPTKLNPYQGLKLDTVEKFWQLLGSN
jgi:hypothetical protein